MLYEQYMRLNLNEYGSLVSQKYIKVAVDWSRHNKHDTKKKKPISELPDKF